MTTTIERYLKNNIDEEVKIVQISDKNTFPLYLKNKYNFFELTILNFKCILAEVLDQNSSLDQLLKQIQKIEEITNRDAVLLYKSVSRYRRKSLIQRRISFVIEDGQMYLPFLGLDLKKTKENLQNKVKYFTASTQMAYLYFMYHKDEIISMTDFSNKMGFNKMTASRALNDLHKLNLIFYEIGGETGRSKNYRRINDPDYFLKGREYLKNPVKKTVYAKKTPIHWQRAGIEALASLSMINSLNHKVVAIDKKKFNMENYELIENQDLIKDIQLTEIQIWEYPPQLFSNKEHVDLVSLYASLKDESDERIEQALEDVMRGESWYTG